MAEQIKQAGAVRLSRKASEALRASAELLSKYGFDELAQNVQKILRDVSRDRFTVAVVGEFSRGKSTFLNNLLEVEALPVGNMPTTAMLTRIRYAQEQGLVYRDEKGNQHPALPLRSESWEGLVANNFGGQDPRGLVVAGVNNPWLRRNNLELLDTPGAGDLEESRARLIGDALLSADGAVIAISATQAMSISEKLFIEQRLIARKTPFLLLVITKLDQIPEAQRGQIIEFVKSKLTLWGMDIPVFVPADISVPERYVAITGMDKVKAHIESWVNDPKRLMLTEKWVLARVDALLSAAIDAAAEEHELACANAQQRSELIEKKRVALEKAQVKWDELLLQMEERCAKAAQQVQKRGKKYEQTIGERMLYELQHTAQPERWWREDRPYRLKVELTSMATSVGNMVSKIVAEDVRWFNGSLEKTFKTTIAAPTMGEVEEELDIVDHSAVSVESLDKKRTIVRAATSAVSILGAVGLSVVGLGFLSVVATMGVGTGASLVSDHVFKGKIADQKARLKDVLQKDIPVYIQDALKGSQNRIRGVYSEIISAARSRQEDWMNAQRKAIEKSVGTDDKVGSQETAQRLQMLTRLRQSLAGE
ncbi:MAG: hypothetical protein E7466_02800 [Ruminococcaceae bacterium]|nr:hypothetical protein [Oscillospiraceae bacterium]